MAGNGKQNPRRPRIEVSQGGASAEEAAAIAAAIEQFLRDTAPAPARAAPHGSRWRRAGLYENVRVDPASTDAWGEREPWGR